MKRIISILIRFVPRPLLQRLAGPGLKLMALLNRGTAVTCPICDRSYKKFLPYGRLRPRANALCPSCLSLERHRLIWLYLQRRTEFFSKQLKVLHIAPEVCYIKRFEKIHRENYITGDIESPLAKIKMDIHEIPFEANEFDVVMCNHVLEHVESDLKAMSEIARVLKPGGWAILQVPFYPPLPEVTFEDESIVNPRERERVFGQGDHVRKFGKDFAQRIQKSGLSVNQDRFAFELTNEEVKKYGIVAEDIFVGTKP